MFYGTLVVSDNALRQIAEELIHPTHVERMEVFPIQIISKDSHGNVEVFFKELDLSFLNAELV